MKDTKPLTGFIGLGVMGWPMASNLARAGYPMKVLDVDTDKAQKFARELGVDAATGAGELADCDFVVTMLPDGHAVRQALVESDNGNFINSARPGLVVIDMSSAAPAGTRELAAELEARGVELVDAPVSGARPRAESGTLTIMMGGNNETALDQATPLLQVMGADLFRCGGSGTGHAVKALNNYMAASAYVAMAESLLIADRFGLDRKTLVDIVNVSTGKSFISEKVAPEHVLEEKYATGFALGLLAKDVGIAAELGQDVELDAPLSRLVRDRFASARDELGYTEDHSAAIKSWEHSLNEG